MATAVVQSNVSDFLSKKQQESPKDLGSEWAELEELHNKKLVRFFFWSPLNISSLQIMASVNIETA